MARLGEIELISRYLAPLASKAYAFGLKDDAAHLYGIPPEGLVVTADAIVAGVHFFDDDAPADVAYKALAVNVSDLAAKGAAPLSYTMTLALNTPPTHAFAEGLSAGFAEAQAAFGIELLGGDTVSSRGPWWIAITAFGVAASRGLVARTSARPGDLIYVTGSLGDSALGLKLRLQNAELRDAIYETDRTYLLMRYLRPEPRLALRSALVECASAAMDISDGLALDLGRMCTASGCGANVDVHAIPLSTAAAHALAADKSLIETVLTGGDDYEILAAVPVGRAREFEEAAAKAGIPVATVGVMTADLGAVSFFGGTDPISLTATGYEHFAADANS